MISFNTTIIEFIELIQHHGHEAFVVGGNVRDALIGKKSLDVDITTSASVEDLKSIFENQIVSMEGEHYQSLSIEYKELEFQVTSYRSDSAYTHHRFPTTQRVISYREDVLRRDFTINALYWNPQKGLIDLVEGLEDVTKRQIRTIGDPLERFEEDALRICRALRFASECEFTIEPSTYAAMLAKAHLLRHLSRERITHEMMRTLNGPGIAMTLSLVHEVFHQAFEFEYIHDFINFEHIVHPLVRWYCVFKSKQHTINDVMNHFAFTRKQKEFIIVLDENTYIIPQCDKVLIKMLLKRLSMDEFGALCQFHLAMGNLDFETYEIIIEIVQEIHLNEEAYTIAQLKIKGDECVKRKMPYTEISKFLNECLDHVIQQPELNNLDYLIQQCELWIQNEK